jgi:hypothetical protein
VRIDSRPSDPGEAVRNLNPWIEWLFEYRALCSRLLPYFLAWADIHAPSRCSLCGRLHRPLPGRCSAGLETVACSESGRWLCCEPGGEWRRCEHRTIDAVMERWRPRAR